MLLLCTTCSKDEVLLTPDGETSALKSAPVTNVPDITIAPSGDLSGVSDAYNIQFALDNLVTGGTILLESGSFYINRTIVAPGGFDGTLQGTGKDHTDIVGVGDDIDPFINDQIYNPYSPYLIEGSSFFFFPDLTGSVTVSNLSASLPDGFATEDNYFEDNNLTAFITVNLAGDGADTHFDNLRLTGTAEDPDAEDPWLFSQPRWGILVLGDRDPSDFPIPSYEGGVHTITSSEISKIGFQATVHETLKNATIEISGNSYSEIRQTMYRWLDGCNLSITKNSMETISWGAIVVTQEEHQIPGNPNAVIISRNNVSTSGYMPIEIGAIPDGTASFMLLIEKNELNNAGPGPLGWGNYAGIGIFYGNDDAVVRNNIVRGEAAFGILQLSNGGTFVGNNLQGINALYAGYGLFGDYNTVVGKGNSTVIDGGVDNIITGLTKVEGESIGLRMQEAQSLRKDILDKIRLY